MGLQLNIPGVFVGPIHRIRFRPGRRCILAAALLMRRNTSKGTLQSEPIEASFAEFGAYEPWVPGTIPGMRVNSGAMHVFEVAGKLTPGNNVAPPWLPPEGASISVMYATVDVAPLGQEIKFRFLRDGAAWTAFRIPAVAGDPYGAVEEVVEGIIDPGSTVTRGEKTPIGYSNLAGVAAGVFVSGLQEANVGGREFRLDITQVGTGDNPGEGLRVYAPY